MEDELAERSDASALCAGAATVVAVLLRLLAPLELLARLLRLEGDVPSDGVGEDAMVALMMVPVVVVVVVETVAGAGSAMALLLVTPPGL